MAEEAKLEKQLAELDHQITQFSERILAREAQAAPIHIAIRDSTLHDEIYGPGVSPAYEDPQRAWAELKCTLEDSAQTLFSIETKAASKCSPEYQAYVRLILGPNPSASVACKGLESKTAPTHEIPVVRTPVVRTPVVRTPVVRTPVAAEEPTPPPVPPFIPEPAASPELPPAAPPIVSEPVPTVSPDDAKYAKQISEAKDFYTLFQVLMIVQGSGDLYPATKKALQDKVSALEFDPSTSTVDRLRIGQLRGRTFDLGSGLARAVRTDLQFALMSVEPALEDRSILELLLVDEPSKLQSLL